MPYFSDYVLDSQGNVIPSATVSVVNAAGTAPSLYSDAARTTAKTQPFTTNSSGFYEFYVAPGTYTITAQSGGFSQTKTVELGFPGVEFVTDFGALGNGTNDDTSAIQAAIDSFSAGGTLRFPRGTYRLTDSLKTKRGLRLVGDGWFATILSGTSMAVPMFKDTSTYTYKDGGMQGMTLVGNTSAAGNHLVQVSTLGVNRYIFDSVRFYECGGDALHIESLIASSQAGSYQNAVRDCIFGDPANASVIRIKGHAIFALGSVNGWVIDKPTIYRTHSTAIYLEGRTGSDTLSTWMIRDASIEGIGADNVLPTFGVYATGHVESIRCYGGFMEGNGVADTSFASANFCVNASTGNYGTFEVRGVTMASTPYHIRVINGYGGLIEGNRFSWNGTNPDAGNKKFCISLEDINSSTGQYRIGHNDNFTTSYELLSSTAATSSQISILT